MYESHDIGQGLPVKLGRRPTFTNLQEGDVRPSFDYSKLPGWRLLPSTPHFLLTYLTGSFAG